MVATDGIWVAALLHDQCDLAPRRVRDGVLLLPVECVSRGIVQAVAKSEAGFLNHCPVECSASWGVKSVAPQYVMCSEIGPYQYMIMWVDVK